jgi:AcrR family transcriptional regulator
MARVIPPGRFEAVVAAAAEVFIRYGFRRAQMQDVADALDLSKGSLYGYAGGKHALFAAALRYADGAEPLPGRDELPVAAPPSGQLAALVRTRLAGEIETMHLTAALARPVPEADGSGPDELAAVLTDLYQRLSRHRTAIKLVDRCAADFPELHGVWFADGRSLQMDALTELLRRRASAGLLQVPGRVDVVARSMIELCVLWAVHRHWDPAPKQLRPAAGAGIPDPEVTATLVQLFTAAVRPRAIPAVP